jgi:hypothetical protein
MSKRTGAENFTLLSLPWEPVDDWSTLRDQNVEIHIGGRVADRGQVADVMADGSVLWLMEDGVSGRRIIENQPGTYIRLNGT